ncbi:CaiB/BaiF CoA transferase family protein [Aneurinibacillus terranovensis]|uniref:CaiB/BaiF CoA transferase family protein n=1 Tax=Aneurinibacillus terranovensis TaxID=278991 RepID=UPI000400F77C|nr:CaiB/BaiF CoA-transferase family protein [Aneurinibacillus terranovensis]
MLNGIRVVDFSLYLPGPYASLRLADMGAEVIKVESPAGDPARVLSATEDGNGDGYVFQVQNRSKKSIVLNLKEAEGQRIAREMIRRADIVIESFRPGVAERLGIGYEQIKQVRPDIIYCSLSGYGQHGMMSHLASHDLNYVALSGVLSQMKDHFGTPIHPSITFADLIGGIAASEAILGALVQRGRSGQGAYLDISLADVLITLMGNHVLLESATGEQHGVPALNKRIISYYIYETRDGRFVSLAALEAKFWTNFCRAVNREDWIPAHLTAPHEDNLVFQEIKELFRSRPLAEWDRLSLEVDCCLAPVLEVGELYGHPYIKERGLIREQWGTRHVATRYTGDETLVSRSTPPPGHGEHTDEVLSELVGASRSQLEEWRKKGVIG